MMQWEQVLIGLVPSLGVGLIFWFALRAVMRADRNERNALAEIDAREAESQQRSDESPGQ